MVQGFGEALLAIVVEAYTASAEGSDTSASHAAMAMHVALKQLARRTDAAELLSKASSLLMWRALEKGVLHVDMRDMSFGGDPMREAEERLLRRQLRFMWLLAADRAATMSGAGRQPHRFQLELMPLAVGGLPLSVDQVSILWQRGAKLQFSDPSPVYGGRAEWAGQVLKQTATMYRDGACFVAKPYTLKVQAAGDVRGRTATVARCTADLARLCACSPAGSHTELRLRLKPAGQLVVKVTVTWLANCPPEDDALTEMSRLSLGPSLPSSAGDDPVSARAAAILHDLDQDLTGFDDGATLKALHGRGGSSPRPPRSLMRATASHPEPDPNPNHSVDPPPFPSCMSSPPDFAGARRPAMRSTEAPSPSRRARGRPRAALQGNFEGFCVQPLDEHDMTTPTIQRPLRSTSGQVTDAGWANGPPGPHHRRVVSDSACLAAGAHAAAGKAHPQSAPAPPGSPASPEDYERMVQECYETLATSESEDEGALASVRRWFSGRKRPQSAPGSAMSAASGARHSTEAMAASVAALDAVNRESDIEALRECCKAALRATDAERLARGQAERRASRLAHEAEALRRAKGNLAARLEQAEAHLMALLRGREGSISEVVSVKLALAQAEYERLRVQGELNQERAKTRLVQARLTSTEAAYHEALNCRRPQALPQGPSEGPYPPSWGPARDTMAQQSLAVRHLSNALSA
ncbi:hypothetical protein WJX81_000003 [Elliptochloris bilobata]|uniref:C2 NT-type domain-containing protein n=1 Tax=Elliptochloris bilobata TaxID=381761 RepID=A0AAW1SDF8_9CHLO